MDTWVWTWGGVSFGYIEMDCLYTYDGRHVGFVDRGPDPPRIFAIGTGRYLGELADPDRLLTRTSRLNLRRSVPSRRPRRMGRMRQMDRMGQMMRVGCRDFPSPEEL